MPPMTTMLRFWATACTRFPQTVLRMIQATAVRVSVVAVSPAAGPVSIEGHYDACAD